MKFDKGARVQIKPGNNGAGVCGEVFWKGPKKWGTGDRLGVRGDDGQTYWIDEVAVEAATSQAPEPEPGDTFSKGDRVSFRNRGQTGTGRVFWVGENKRGPGQRLGINDDEGEDAVWLDARFASHLDDDPGPSPETSAPNRHQRAPAQPFDSDETDEIPWSPPIQMDELPPAPPMDDAMVDAWAHEMDADDNPF